MSRIEATILTSQAHIAMALAGLTLHQSDKDKLVELAENLTKYVKDNYK